MSEGPILLFDGECGLCHRTVQFVLRHDHARTFRFAPLRSATGRALLVQHGLDPARTDTMVLVEGGRAGIRSTAALRMLARLGWPWKVMAMFLIVPRVVRDAVYRLIARNRYRLFGRVEACALPPEGFEGRLLQ